MINELKKVLKKNNWMIGMYGVEREMLRVDKDGMISFKLHPEELGDKFTNPYITTDFAESQIEIITPPLSTMEEVYGFLNLLYDTVALNIGEELLWPQSMPSIITDRIPVAEFGDHEDARKATEYRERLLLKYGGKKQLISGLHFNFSVDEEIIKVLYENGIQTVNYRNFKEQVYLKAARNYLRYRWLLVYIMGNTTTVHGTFIDDSDCTKCFKEINKDSFYLENGISYRNGECGYRNLIDLYPDYSSVENYVKSIEKYISDGLIDSHKELYSQVRIKPGDTEDFLNSLKTDGIKYLEFRTIDVNPFERSGISLDDLRFLELFNIYILLKEESDYELWQEEAMENQNLISKFGKKTIKLKKDGEYILKDQWIKNILREIADMAEEMGCEYHIIDKILERVSDMKMSYAYRIEEMVRKMGYEECYLSLAEKYKLEAQQERSYYGLNGDIDEMRKKIIEGRKEVK